MKKLSFLFIALLALDSCNQPTSTQTDTAQAESGTVEQKAEVAAVCIWDNLSVRAAADSKSQWLTSISIGESLTLQGESAVDSADNNREYVKVKLADGKEGWTQKTLLVEGGTAAVFTQAVPIYKRPDLLTKTENTFSEMDIVAIKGVQEGWVEVTGKRKEGKWIETGWVKKESLSSNNVDIATAKFSRIALEETDTEKRKQALASIVENPDFAGSAFIPRLQGELEGLTADPMQAEADTVQAL